MTSRPPNILPPTTTFELDPAAQLLPGQNGTWVLLGGSPYVLLTLKERAAQTIRSLRSGADIETAAIAGGVSLSAVERLARKLLSTGIAEPQFHAPNRVVADQVTAVVPVLNEGAVIGALVQSLRSAGVNRVIVVDDGSTDDTVPNATMAGATVLHTLGRVGPGPARNTGLKNVHTPLVLFIDADVIPIGEWLAPLLRAFTDTTVAAAAPRVGSVATVGLIGDYERIRSPLDLGSRRASVRPKSRVAYVPTAALLAEVETVRSLGGFADALRTGEDVDLVWRMAAAGHVVRYEPDAEVAHRPRASITAFVRQRRSYGRSAAALDQRHPGQVAPVVASGWSVLVWAMGMLGGPVGVVAAAATAASTAALLERKLQPLAHPRKPAWTLAMRGHWGVGRQLASAMWRAWIPFALVACVFSRRARVAMLAAGAIPNILEWHERRPSLGPPKFVAMRLLDDASYCAGVWEGCIRNGTFRVLRPQLINWPGNRNESKVD